MTEMTPVSPQIGAVQNKATTFSNATTANEEFGPFEELKATGYPQLADLMGRHGEIAIFRKFGALNILNLMSLQAELLDLQEDLKNLYQDDQSNTTLRDFYAMRNSPLHQEKMVDIRGKLGEYSNIHCLFGRRTVQ
jgi:hypothetical protein